MPLTPSAWPPLDAGAVDPKTAEMLLWEVKAYLEAQQRGLESLRGRLLDLARQATTLATLTAGAIVVGLSSKQLEVPPYAYAAAYTATAIWIAAAIAATMSVMPDRVGYPGRPARAWWDGNLLRGQSAPLLLMARQSEDSIIHNDGRETELARRLRVAIWIYVLALPAAGNVAAIVAGNVWAILPPFVTVMWLILRDALLPASR